MLKRLFDFLLPPALPTEKEARQKIYASYPLLEGRALHVRKESTTETSYEGGVWTIMSMPHVRTVTRYYLEPRPYLGYKPGEVSIEIQRPD
jgi:hypothetical protein